jgi:hypothetical protein
VPFGELLTRGLSGLERLVYLSSLDAAHSVIADRIAVIIHVDPLTAPDMSSGRGGNPDFVCPDKLCFRSELKVELSRFARLRVGIEDRCLDDSVDHDSDFINANCQASGAVMAGSVGLNNPGKTTPVCCFNPDISAFDGMPGGIFHDPFESGRPALGTER